MKKRNIVILIVVLFFIIVLGAYFRYAYLDYKNTEYGKDFPSSEHGVEFISKMPSIAQENDGTIKINWSLSEKCNYNTIEIQEENYRASADSYWGGSGDESCDEQNGTYLCEASFSPENFKSGKEYFAQVRSNWCENNAGIAGPIFSFTKK